MKIAFVTNTCWNIYNFRKGLVQTFIEEGHEVLAIAPRDEYTEHLQRWGLKWIDTPLESTGANPIKDVAYLKKLVHVFKQEKPDVALSYTIKSNIYASLAGKYCGVSTVCNVSGLGTVFLVKGIVGKLAIQLYKVSFRFSSHIFFQNEDDLQLFTSIIKVAPSRIGKVPGSGIDLVAFPHLPWQRKETTKFLMISRLIVEKGVREFAEAASHFAHDERVRFTLVGKLDVAHSRSVSEEDLNKWISNKWIDYLPHSNRVQELIESHDVVVLPSYREGTPRTLLEGAATGRALLAADVPGCKEVVQDGFNGFLFQVKNADALTEKAKLFLSLHDEEKALLAGNSRQLVEQKFSVQLVINAYKDVIHRITGMPM